MGVGVGGIGIDTAVGLVTDLNGVDEIIVGDGVASSIAVGIPTDPEIVEGKSFGDEVILSCLTYVPEEEHPANPILIKMMKFNKWKFGFRFFISNLHTPSCRAKQAYDYSSILPKHHHIHWKQIQNSQDQYLPISNSRPYLRIVPSNQIRPSQVDELARMVGSILNPPLSAAQARPPLIPHTSPHPLLVPPRLPNPTHNNPF
jgi:hypothetical protein